MKTVGLVHCTQCHTFIPLDPKNGAFFAEVNRLLAEGYTDVEFFCATCSDTSAPKMVAVEKQS